MINDLKEKSKKKTDEPAKKANSSPGHESLRQEREISREIETLNKQKNPKML
jgi:hypothetical protein